MQENTDTQFKKNKHKTIDTMNGKFNKDIEILKKKQILEQKTTIDKIKKKCEWELQKQNRRKNFWTGGQDFWNDPDGNK